MEGNGRRRRDTHRRGPGASEVAILYRPDIKPNRPDIRVTVNVPAFLLTLWQDGREVATYHAGVFAYCLGVMRTVRGGGEGVFVLSLSVAFAVVLAVLAIGFLIYFIHHTAASIRASSVIASAARETTAAVDHLFPEEVGRGAAEAAPEGEELAGVAWQEVVSESTGYVQSVDEDALVNLAVERWDCAAHGVWSRRFHRRGGARARTAHRAPVFNHLAVGALTPR